MKMIKQFMYSEKNGKNFRHNEDKYIFINVKVSPYGEIYRFIGSMKNKNITTV